MFKLYSFIDKPTFIAKKNDEEDIINILSKCIYVYNRIEYAIVKNEGFGDEAYKSILNEKDYLEYIQEYVKNNKPLTRKRVKK